MRNYTEERKKELNEYRKTHYNGIYGSWYAMKGRCLNPNNIGYINYGGRGITVCDKWLKFQGFKEDMWYSYKKGSTIDRIDNNKGYSKENCKWSNRKEQNNNKRSNIVLTFNGETKSISYWAESLGIPFGTIRSRFYRGMSIEQILKNDLYRPRKLKL